MAYRARRSGGVPEVALGGMRAGAVAVLGLVAVAGAAVAGMEKALTPPAVPDSPAPITAAAPAPAAVGPADAQSRRAGPPCAPPVRICVRLSGSSAWLLTSKGAVLGPVPVRHGRPDSPTPVGLFPVQAKDAHHVNSVTGSPMPYAMFFAGDLAIYQAELNQPSVGSVRLPAGPAAQFFREASVGDLIQVVP
ncbi:MAG: L,D-transpeptidase [Pseudonocardiaceae bacterium]